MAYVIEKGIPVARVSLNKGVEFPFKDMVPGDSFRVNAEEANRARVGASTFGRLKGWVFRTRQDGDGVRIWRIA